MTRRPAWWAAVYPRPRGEASASLPSGISIDGLSPPTRGSPRGSDAPTSPGRSIPAHAGKPWASCSRPWASWVYPRPRGEAGASLEASRQTLGLSPPTRGSQLRSPSCSAPGGSIPAHAGKPGHVVRPRPAPTVYPRPRGEALAEKLRHVGDAGLSPPTRGSPRGVRSERPTLRSIPAHAGKPRTASISNSPPGVYPRPRGEAIRVPGLASAVEGLSPPTRGSQLHAPPLVAPGRSIPAHAGKPIWRSVT